jgi:hypothetical protein
MEILSQLVTQEDYLASTCSALRIIAMVWLWIPPALPARRRLLGNYVSPRGIQDLLEFHPLNSILLWERPAATVLHEHRPRSWQAMIRGRHLCDDDAPY